jgi:hypothetical protein
MSPRVVKTIVAKRLSIRPTAIELFGSATGLITDLDSNF